MDVQFAVQVAVACSLYSLIGAGYVLVYKASRVLNLTTGEYLIVAPYLSISMMAAGVLPSLVWVVVSIVCTGVFGAIIFLVLIKRMTGYPVFSVVLMSVGLAIAVRSVCEIVYTARPRYLIDMVGFENQVVSIAGGGYITVVEIAQIALACMLLVSVGLILKFSRVGLQLRASGESVILAAQRGVDVERAFAVAWGLAAVCVGTAGILFSLNVRLDPGVADQGLRALAVPLAGGLTSLTGVFCGGLIVALVEVGGVRVAGPLIGSVAPYFVVLLFILLRPWGLFGVKEELERV